MPQRETRQRILDAATTLFLQQGYGSTNLEQVAAKADVTKPTVYSHFGSKQGLLDAMTERHTETRLEEFKAELSAGGSPEETLVRFADAFLARVLSDEARAWQRLAASESGRYPEVGEAFYNAGPRRVFGFLTRYLRSEHQAGRLLIPNVDRAAEHFLGMLLGLDLLRSLVGQSIPSQATRRRRCRETVKVFLAAYGGQDDSVTAADQSEALR